VTTVEPRVECVVAPDGWRVYLRGDIDLGSQHLLDEAYERVSGADPGDIVVDLTQLTFLSSNGLGFLARLHAHVEPSGYAITIRGANYVARRALEVTGMEQLFTITPD
jgi:anti-anti-sigma factor